jgi:hypothetical protein
MQTTVLLYDVSVSSHTCLFLPCAPPCSIRFQSGKDHYCPSSKKNKNSCWFVVCERYPLCQSVCLPIYIHTHTHFPMDFYLEEGGSLHGVFSALVLADKPPYGGKPLLGTRLVDTYEEISVKFLSACPHLLLAALFTSCTRAVG